MAASAWKKMILPTEELLGMAGGHIPYNATRRPPDERTSARMRAVHVSGTAPELRVRQLVSALGHRYRTNVQTLVGRPDLANKSARWAILVHGCYWHGHKCRQGRMAKINIEFWHTKIARNQLRDTFVLTQLQSAGFEVLTVWQCDLDNERRLIRRLKYFFERIYSEFHSKKSFRCYCNT